MAAPSQERGFTGAPLVGIEAWRREKVAEAVSEETGEKSREGGGKK